MSKKFNKENVYKFINGPVKDALTVYLLLLIPAALLGLYAMGMVHGYNIGKFDNPQELTPYVSSKPVSSKDSVTPTPGPDDNDDKVDVVTYSVYKDVNWGGPELWESVNNRRVQNGVNPLSTRSELCTIASIRLNELLEIGKLDAHEGFSNLTERREDLQWIFDKYANVTEFLAYGGETAEETVDLWENTLGHSKLVTGGEYVWGCTYAQNSFAVAISAY